MPGVGDDFPVIILIFLKFHQVGFHPGRVMGFWDDVVFLACVNQLPSPAQVTSLIGEPGRMLRDRLEMIDAVLELDTTINTFFL